MSTLLKRTICIAAAILLAVVSYYYFIGWFNIVPWAIATLVIGYVATGRKDILINGALFGYFLFAFYIFLGYKGRQDTKSMWNFVIFTLLFSLIGAGAGVAGVFLGSLFRRRAERIRNTLKP